jgi:hypothetical protein
MRHRAVRPALARPLDDLGRRREPPNGDPRPGAGPASVILPILARSVPLSMSRSATDRTMGPLETQEVVVSVLARFSSTRGSARSVGAGVRAAVVALAASLVVALSGAPALAASPALAGDVEARPAVELARAFTAALNARDADALADLFGDAGAGPTVEADRYAWNRHEIRLWAREQSRLGIHVDAYDYQASEHGATWSATVRRDDWSVAGVEALAQTHTIWVEDGKLVAFRARLDDPRAADLLGHLWRPGASPDEPWASAYEFSAPPSHLAGRG